VEDDLTKLLIINPTLPLKEKECFTSECSNEYFTAPCCNEQVCISQLIAYLKDRTSNTIEGADPECFGCSKNLKLDDILNFANNLKNENTQLKTLIENRRHLQSKVSVNYVNESLSQSIKKPYPSAKKNIMMIWNKRACIKCRTILQHFDGTCKFVVCARCNCVFCFICLTPGWEGCGKDHYIACPLAPIQKYS